MGKGLERERYLGYYFYFPPYLPPPWQLPFSLNLGGGVSIEVPALSLVS